MAEGTGKKRAPGWRKAAKIRRLGPNWMDAEMISLEYGCGKRTVYDWVVQRKLRAQRRGPRSLVFERKAVEAFFAGTEVGEIRVEEGWK